MGKKKVLLISPLPPPVGGIATWTKKYIDQGVSDEFKLLLVDTKILGVRKNFQQPSINPIELRRNISIVCKHLLAMIRLKPDIVHLNCSLSPNGIFRDAVSAVITKIFRIPLITHYRGNVVDFPTASNFGINYRILKLLFMVSNVNIVLNSASKKYLSDVCNKAPRNVIIVPNFIEDCLLSYKAEFRNKKVKVIYVGAIIKEKGIEEIIEIARQLKRVQFECIGDLIHKYDDLPDNLVFSGPIGHSAVLEKLSKSDLFLFPSHSEGFPNAVLEAMAVGLPIVASNVGAIPEMVSSEQGGYIVEARNPTKFKNAISKLVLDRLTLKKMGNHNRKIVLQRYTYSKVSRMLSEVYNSLL